MKRLMIAVLVFLILIAGSIIFLLKTNKSDEVKQPTTVRSANSNTENATNNGNYLDYSPEAFSDASGTRLLFFYASWCPQCRSPDEDIKTQGTPAGVTIFKVDYDTNQSLRQKYGVTLQTTIVKVDQEGKLVKKYVAYDNPTIDAVKLNIL